MATQIVNQYVRPAVPSAFEPTKPHASVYEIVTNRILVELEKGQAPWRTPQRGPRVAPYAVGQSPSIGRSMLHYLYLNNRLRRILSLS